MNNLLHLLKKRFFKKKKDTDYEFKKVFGKQYEEDTLTRHLKYTEKIKQFKKGNYLEKNPIPNGLYVYKNDPNRILAEKHKLFFENMTKTEYEKWIKENRTDKGITTVFQIFDNPDDFQPK